MLDTTGNESSRSNLVARRTLRVLSVPPRHPYITAVTPTAVQPVAPHRTKNWEPDPLFEEGAIADLAEVDVVHVHFSYDHMNVADMQRWLAELRARNVPLVLTVHDLRNPHHGSREQHDQLLATMVPAAAAVITLTPGAADEIATRFGVRAIVAPHPTMTDPVRSASVPTEPGLVALNLKFMRRNIVDAVAVIEATALGAADSGGRVRVDVHPEALAHPKLQGLQDVPGIELAVHAPFDDTAFEQYVRRAQVAVLPYRWGTHSGWLEMARDLGTRVVAPDCGYFTDQWSEVISYTSNEADGLDPISLRKAVAYALEQPPLPVADHAARLAEAAAVRRTHESLYRRLLR